jgi:catechol 2,3-dioxygenase-like lactoylglutathione lyase family enzyme
VIDHLSFYATDFDATKKFYDAVLPPLGYAKVMEMVSTWDPSWPTRRMIAYGTPPKATFWVIEHKEKPTPRHLAFHAKSQAHVRAFHEAALKVGAKDNGAPGPRPQYHPGYYGAFVFDPDGNNVEACCHKPE